MKGATLMAAAAALAIGGVKDGNYHGRKAWLLSNGKIEVVVTPGGGHIASLALKDGPAAGLNPSGCLPGPVERLAKTAPAIMGERRPASCSGLSSATTSASTSSAPRQLPRPKLASQSTVKVRA